MKIVTDMDLEDEEVEMADWKDGPSDALRGIDKQLEAHGLEVVMLDAEDHVFFRIEKRQ